jgi:hypothetical protein
MSSIGPHDSAVGTRPENTAVEGKSRDEEQACELALMNDSSSDNAEGGSEITAINLNTFMRRMSADSVREIDGLIDHLQTLRKKLLGDGDRVERDIVEYTAMGQSVAQLTKIVSDSVSRLKGARD